MAIFPALNRKQADDTQSDTGLINILAPDGNQYGQSYYSDEFYLFTPTFIGLDEAAKTNLEAFYKTNKLLAFDYVYADAGFPDITYECRFVSGIRFVRTEARTPNGLAGLYEAYVQFRGKLKP